MVSKGVCEPGAATAHLPPLSVGNLVAIRIWNRLDGNLQWPAVAYEIRLAGVGQPGLMLERLHALRSYFRSVIRRNG